jgi:ZIP family zinc transporter
LGNVTVGTSTALQSHPRGRRIDNHVAFLLIAGSAALASPLGGWFGSRFRTGTLFLSIATGLAGGVLLGTFAFEMLPESVAAAGRFATVGGFVTGFAVVYLVDLYLNRGFIAGEGSDEWHRLSRLHRRRRVRDSQVTLLAGGTAIEELIEGLSIGVGLAVDPTLGVLIGAAIVLDNLVEGMSIAEIIRAELPDGASRQIFAWTGLIGLALFSSATVGWLVLRDISGGVMGTLLAIGAGGMFYLAVTDLLPRSAKTQFQQSAALAAATGFLLMFSLSVR